MWCYGIQTDFRIPKPSERSSNLLYDLPDKQPEKLAVNTVFDQLVSIQPLRGGPAHSDFSKHLTKSQARKVYWKTPD